jgi:phage anti-repressor protein
MYKGNREARLFREGPTKVLYRYRIQCKNTLRERHFAAVQSGWHLRPVPK